tara:strand:+ start:1830 stop:2183 length:354 start_codon:yes stop_codon:yes gene_type:complete
VKNKPKKVQKIWGHELWLANDEENNYCGKILNIKNGHKFSMHYHSDKHETFYILEGMCILRSIDTETATQVSLPLNEGDCYTIDRLVPHQIEALTDCVIIESSTFHKDEDSYRIWRD